MHAPIRLLQKHANSHDNFNNTDDDYLFTQLEQDISNLLNNKNINIRSPREDLKHVCLTLYTQKIQ